MLQSNHMIPLNMRLKNSNILLATREKIMRSIFTQLMSGLQAQWTRTSAGNMRLAKVAVQFSADSFVVNQTLVLRINICGKNRQLLAAANR